jgi:hypothetical protein
MKIKGLKIGGLKTPSLTPVPGVVSPNQSNSATPNKVGSQAVVKTPKASKMGQATDKPSVFFKKSEHGNNEKGVDKLRFFLESVKNKRNRV